VVVIPANALPRLQYEINDFGKHLQASLLTPLTKLRKVGQCPEFSALWTCYCHPFQTALKAATQLNSVMCEYTCTFITLSVVPTVQWPRVRVLVFPILNSNIGVASNKVNTAFYNTAALVQLSPPDVPFWQAHRSEKNLINFMTLVLLLHLVTLKQSVMTLRMACSGLHSVFKSLLQFLCIYKLVCL